MRWPLRVLASAGALAAVGWLGLQVMPAPFPPYPQPAVQLERVPPRENLPPPVERYYRALYGDAVPLIETAVLTGRGTLRFGPLPVPVRFRFTHEAGRGYRHYFEVTWFGRPIMKVNESFLDGRGRMELPSGIVEGPKTSSAANLGMWAEAMAFPAILVTDRRVRWEPIDADHARLIVPSPDGEDSLIVAFDPTSGLIRTMEAMRWRAEEDGARRRWTAEELGDGRSAASWDDDPPWLVFRYDDVVLNADVSSYIRARDL